MNPKKTKTKEHCVMKLTNDVNGFFLTELEPILKWRKKKMTYAEWMDERWLKIKRQDIYSNQANVERARKMMEGLETEDLQPVLRPCDGKFTRAKELDQIYLWPSISLYQFKFLPAGGMAKCRCQACGFLFEEKLLVCRGCKVARYCSKECAAKAWPEHKADCSVELGQEKKKELKEQKQQAPALDLVHLQDKSQWILEDCDHLTTFLQTGDDIFATSSRTQLGYPTKTTHPRLHAKLVKIFESCGNDVEQYVKSALKMTMLWQDGVRITTFIFGIKSLMGKMKGTASECLHCLYSYMQDKVDFESEENSREKSPSFVKVYVNFIRRKDLAPIGPFELTEKEFEKFKETSNPEALKLLKFEVKKIERTYYM